MKTPSPLLSSHILFLLPIRLAGFFNPFFLVLLLLVKVEISEKLIEDSVSALLLALCIISHRLNPFITARKRDPITSNTPVA